MSTRYSHKRIRPDVLDQIQRSAVARYLDKVVGSTFGRSRAVDFIVAAEREQLPAALQATCSTKIARLVPTATDDFDDDEETTERTMIGPALGPARLPGAHR